MNTVSIRGAITADNNSKEAISAASIELYSEILKRNKFAENDIVQIIFSMTKDLDEIYPAKALREAFGLADTPLFCLQEADIKGALPMCIRVLITINSEMKKSEVRHVYLKGAAALRPDLSNN